MPTDNTEDAREIVKVLRDRGWTAQDFARETGASLRTAYRWIRGDRQIFSAYQRALRDVAQREGLAA